MFELRSAIRTREGLFAGALDDALKAQQVPKHRVECKKRASARYWEARALEGLNKPSTAGAAYLGALELSSPRGLRGFRGALPCVARDRFYWQAKRTVVEKIFDDSHFVPTVQTPGPPRPTLARAYFVGDATMKDAPAPYLAAVRARALALRPARARVPVVAQARPNTLRGGLRHGRVR